MAVAAAQKRAAVSAPAEVSLDGTPDSVMPASSAPPEQLPAAGHLSADVAEAPELTKPSEAEQTSPDTDVISIVGEATSQKALSEMCSMERSGYALLLPRGLSSVQAGRSMCVSQACLHLRRRHVQ